MKGIIHTHQTVAMHRNAKCAYWHLIKLRTSSLCANPKHSINFFFNKKNTRSIGFYEPSSNSWVGKFTRKTEQGNSARNCRFGPDRRWQLAIETRRVSWVVKKGPFNATNACGIQLRVLSSAVRQLGADFRSQTWRSKDQDKLGMSQPVIHPYENIGTSKFNESLLDTTLGRLSFIARAIPAYTKVFQLYSSASSQLR